MRKAVACREGMVEVERRRQGGVCAGWTGTELDELGKGCGQLNHFLQLIHPTLNMAPEERAHGLLHSLWTWPYDLFQPTGHTQKRRCADKQRV